MDNTIKEYKWGSKLCTNPDKSVLLNTKKILKSDLFFGCDMGKYSYAYAQR